MLRHPKWITVKTQEQTFWPRNFDLMLAFQVRSEGTGVVMIFEGAPLFVFGLCTQLQMAMEGKVRRREAREHALQMTC